MDNAIKVERHADFNGGGVVLSRDWIRNLYPDDKLRFKRAIPASHRCRTHLLFMETVIPRPRITAGARACANGGKTNPERARTPAGSSPAQQGSSAADRLALPRLVGAQEHLCTTPSVSAAWPRMRHAAASTTGPS